MYMQMCTIKCLYKAIIRNKNTLCDNLAYIYVDNRFRDVCLFFPESSPNVINVGTAKMEDGDNVLYQTFLYGTNLGKCVSLYAPGESANHQFR